MEIIIINNKNEPFARLLEMLLLVRWFPFVHTAREIGQAGQTERERKYHPPRLHLIIVYVAIRTFFLFIVLCRGLLNLPDAI